MKIRLILLIIFCSIIDSCRQPEKSNKMMHQALEVYNNQLLKENVKIDSSLVLTNKALEFDDQNFYALHHKATILFRKKDSEGLIQNSERLIQLTSEYPTYLGQKALYLDLKGDSKEAIKYYQKALSKYKQEIKNDSLNFDLMIEYVGILEASGDTSTANQTLSKMKEMSFEEYQKEILKIYKKETVTIEQLRKYWTGEIEYDQITAEQKLPTTTKASFGRNDLK